MTFRYKLLRPTAASIDLNIQNKSGNAHHSMQGGSVRFRAFQDPAVENAVILVVIAIVAGVLGGGVIGLVTAHRTASPSSSNTAWH